jgi:3-oxoacyl-[acyl-carrier protein] reductase
MSSDKRPWRVLVFGASGAIGESICGSAGAKGWRVVGVARKPGSITISGSDHRAIAYDPFASVDLREALGSAEVFDAVVWAQGANLTDSVHDVEVDAHLELYKANCLFVLITLRQLLDAGLLSRDGARLCVISSIWQERARQTKLSYTMTKAAVGGLVRSAAIDLAKDGHLINGVLPGALDTPMTYANLSEAQLKAIEGATPFGRLTSVDTVADLVTFLCSAQNSSVSGQSIAVDLGFSNVRLV